MFQYKRMVSICFVLSAVTHTGWTNFIPTVPGCGHLKSYSLYPQEKIEGLPKLLPNNDEDDANTLIKKQYYAKIATAYLNQAEKLGNQSSQWLNRASKLGKSTSLSHLRSGKNLSHTFSIQNMSRVERENSSHAHQLRVEAATLNKKRDEMIDKAKYYLCVAENVD